MVMFNLTVLSQVKSEYVQTYENDTCAKSLLYHKSKMYIVDLFKSANNVIQNDDKEFGIITCKGTTSISGYYFHFTLKIRVKDGASKITISDIYNSSAPYKNHTIILNEYEGIWKTNLTKKQYDEIMSLLDREMNKILIGYMNYMHSEEDDF